MFLALFVASIVATSLTPLVGSAHAFGHDDGARSQASSSGAGADQTPADEGKTCNHGCHLLQHFQGSVDQPPMFGVQRWSGVYAAAEFTAPPQLSHDTHLRPPRVPARPV